MVNETPPALDWGKKQNAFEVTFHDPGFNFNEACGFVMKRVAGKEDGMIASFGRWHDGLRRVFRNCRYRMDEHDGLGIAGRRRFRARGGLRGPPLPEFAQALAREGRRAQQTNAPTPSGGDKAQGG